MGRVRNILFLSGQSEMGGGEKSLLELVRNLDGDRYCPVVVLPSEGSLARKLGEYRVRYLTGFSLPGLRGWGFLRWPAALFRLARIVAKEKADLLHGNGTRENIAAAVVGILMRKPSVWHLRNLVAPGMMDLEKPLSFLPARIVANSRAVAGRLRGLPWAKRRISVVYNGVDMHLFEGILREEARSELGAGDGDVLVGIVGRIGVGKGHELFVRAAKRVSEEKAGSCLRFAIIGDELFTGNGRRREVVQLVEELGLSDRLICTGYRDDVERLIAALDILVLASEGEPFGRVLIEAMAAGKPVVATSAGGVKEVVEGGVSALLVRPGDERLMASAISRLSADAGLRERMGNSGRERVRRKFTIDEHVSRIQRIYDELLGNNGRQN